MQLLARSDAAIETDNATELTAINADGGSGAGNFSSQTDAEEAIKDALSGDAQTGATAALVAVNLDHLMKTPVANNANMTTEVADGTVLSNIMTTGSDTSDFVVATDAMQSIRDAITANAAAVVTALLADASWAEGATNVAKLFKIIGAYCGGTWDKSGANWLMRDVDDDEVTVVTVTPGAAQRAVTVA